MDLLASYASDDDDEQEQLHHHHQQQQQQNEPSPLPQKPSLFSLLPPPDKSPSLSLLSSLPQPKSTTTAITKHKNDIKHEDDDFEPKASPFKSTATTSTSLFSSLPKPKTEIEKQPISNFTTLDKNTKRVVQFRPPVYTSLVKSATWDEEEEEEEEEEKQRKRRKQAEASALLQSDSSSVRSFLSSIPAPRNSSSLGVGTLGSGSGRRSIIETETPTSSSAGSAVEHESRVDQSREENANYENSNYDVGYVAFEQKGGDYVNHGSYGPYDSYESGVDQNVAGVGNGSGDYGDGGYGGYESYEGYESGNYGDYAQYGNTWGDGSVAAVAETAGASESAVRVMGKRGRDKIPTEIIEVKQDELMKNRPREDQVKSTGIAFGPSYQPASSKGKPSKLHKRKHQIGTLYFDMKQKETELAERRSRGFLTKAETHAKYGW